jgi:hypothetical protein
MTTKILVILAMLLPNGDHPQFKSPVSGTSHQSCSIGEETCAFAGALLAGVHCQMQVRSRAIPCQGASCKTVATWAFVPPGLTHHVDVNITQSSHCCRASLHSSPSFFPPVTLSLSLSSPSPPPPPSRSFLSWWPSSPPSSGPSTRCHESKTSLLGGYSGTQQPKHPCNDVALSFQNGRLQGQSIAVS